MRENDSTWPLVLRRSHNGLDKVKIKSLFRKLRDHMTCP